jgi:hypothetical protein
MSGESGNVSERVCGREMMSQGQTEIGSRLGRERVNQREFNARKCRVRDSVTSREG